VFPWKKVGFRFEGRGFYTPINSSGSLACRSGVCLFSFSGSGLWQGEVSAAVVVGLGTAPHESGNSRGGP
jgi:hypothetical protein